MGKNDYEMQVEENFAGIRIRLSYGRFQSFELPRLHHTGTVLNFHCVIQQKIIDAERLH